MKERGGRSGEKNLLRERLGKYKTSEREICGKTEVERLKKDRPGKAERREFWGNRAT